MRSQVWAEILKDKIRSPLAVALGAHRQVAGLLAGLAVDEVRCYQMDLHQAGRLREDLAAFQPAPRIITSADLWDLPADFQTVLLPSSKGEERSVRIDMVEQAFHLLRPGGTVVVLSPYQPDRLFATPKKLNGGATQSSPPVFKLSPQRQQGPLLALRAGVQPESRRIRT
jgi:hypothetical protein